MCANTSSNLARLAMYGGDVKSGYARSGRDVLMTAFKEDQNSECDNSDRETVLSIGYKWFFWTDGENIGERFFLVNTQDTMKFIIQDDQR